MSPLLWCLVALPLAGCAAVAPQQVGQVVGTIAGAAAAPGIGAPLGALGGMLAGMLVQGQIDRATEKRERVELRDQLGSPRLPVDASSAPGAPEMPPQGEPTRVWVDETLLEGRLIAGHFEERYVP